MDFFELVALVLAFVAWVRSGRTKKELLARIDALERSIAKLRSTAASGPLAGPPARSAIPIESEDPDRRAAVAGGPREETHAPPPLQAPPPEAPSAPSEPAAPRASSVDWERWLGVQGAAVLGGAVLALAGLLFFRYSIERGLITPAMRVTLGVLVGLACIAGPRARRFGSSYPWAAEAITGAGIAILYAAFWAAGPLYDLVSTGVAFVLMVLVTAAGCLLAVRERSLLIALLGLIGGFATPFLVSSGSDRPLGLFGYILLLDVALLAMARRRGWPILAAMSLFGTLLYQAFWIGGRMGPDRVWIGLGVLALFSVVFAIGARTAGEGDLRTWRISRIGGVLLPFALVLYVSGASSLRIELLPLAGLVLLLAAAASWVGRSEGNAWIALGAASASITSLGVWLRTRPDDGAAWAFVGCLLALAAVHHAFLEWRHPNGRRDAAAPALLAAGGLFLLAVVGAAGSASRPFWPWLVGWLGLGGFVLRQARLLDRAAPAIAAAVALAIALALVRFVHEANPVFPSWTALLGVSIAVGAALQAVALAGRGGPGAERAAAIFGIVLVPLLAATSAGASPPVSVFLPGTFGLGFLAVLAATRAGSGALLLAAVAATAFAQTIWTETSIAVRDDPGGALAALAFQAAAVLAFTAWPFAAAARLRQERLAWVASALAAPLWFWSMRRLWLFAWGDGAIGALPVALAAVAIGALAGARDLWPREDERRTSALAWFGAVALGFVSVAIPLQLEKEWTTIGWAVEGAVTLVLWSRLDHPGLKYFAVALLGAATIRLVANQAVLGYYPRPSWRIVNWLLYTYLVPAASLVYAAAALAKLELGRLRSWERALYPAAQPLGAGACGLAAVVVVFVWINLAIADWFSSGEWIRLSFARMPARDLATSISWAAYALVLLAIGVRLGASALRWVSLAVLLLAIAKVFLHDLGELEDLFRVLSLLGLAVSLILVSLGYQRFVFRKAPEEGR